MYFNGKGVSQSVIYSHLWFNIAARHGITYAAEITEFMEQIMTTQNISRAEELAKKCINKKYKDC